MAAPAHAITISRAAELLGEDEELLWDLADQMEPEDGLLWIYGTHDQQTIAFTDPGLDICGSYSGSIKPTDLPPAALSVGLRDDAIACTCYFPPPF